jgi:hypothetical protein
MDEMVGYFPPVAMPPSKPPLLLLLKQARAFGLGLVLATQNPVDLDYKGLSNAGTWFIGRLQTERDKMRVLDGLEGAASGSGFDRETVDRTLSGLKKRHFYVHDVHAERPVVIESRWTLSYLRGPLARDEIKRLTGGAPPPAAPATSKDTVVLAPRAPAVEPRSGGERPVLPPDVPQVFFPTTTPRPIYRPWVVGAARVLFADERTKLDFSREVMFVAPVGDGPLALRWEDAKWAGNVALGDLASEPVPGATFLDPPPAMLVAKSYAGWSKKLAEWLAHTQGVARWKSAPLKAWSLPNEDERSFRARLAQQTREARDAEIAELRDKFGSKIATLEERIRRAQTAVAEKHDAAQAERTHAAAGVGAGFLGVILGGTVRGAMRNAERAAGRASRASQKERAAEREKENLDTLLAKHLELQREAKEALAKVSSALDPATGALENVVTKPKKTGITIHLVALAWRAD